MNSVRAGLVPTLLIGLANSASLGQAPQASVPRPARIPLAGGPDAVDWVPNGSNLNFTAGNISIGTTNPAYPLYVVGGGQAVILGSTNTPTGVSIGVWGQSSSTNGRGIYGYATSATGGSYGGLFRALSNQGIGVYALADATTGTTAGIRGQSASSSGIGLWGLASSATGDTTGVYGKVNSPTGTGVHGFAGSATGVNYGVYGETANLSDGFGVYSVGDSATTGLKLFQIDHPLDPANRFLNHFSAEGPEPYLVYRGTVTLNQLGAAAVDLPDYFESINRDPQYQLTPIGAPANLYIAQEVVNNRFIIAGGEPGMKVCWTVTAVRNDAFVQRYGVKQEPIKTQAQRGRYLHPELYNQPASRAIHQIADDHLIPFE
jgi:hypothetical protein